MGTWGAPATKAEKTELRKKLKEFKKLQDEISNIFGDDILWDAFAEANERIQYAIRSKWTGALEHRTVDCKHPAFIGDMPGVCKLCRPNLPDDGE